MTRTIEEIVEEIVAIYPSYKAQERKLLSLKEVLKHHHTIAIKDSDEDRLMVLGMMLHYKARPTYQWKKDELNEELENLGCLPMAKKINSHVSKFVKWVTTNEDGQEILEPLSQFALTSEKYVHPYPKRRGKQEIELENTILDNYAQVWKKSELDDTVTEFKIEKLEHDTLNHKYSSLKNELAIAMMEEDISSIQSELGSFKIMQKEPEYNIPALWEYKFLKDLEYSIRPLDGQIEIIDHFSKQTIITTDDVFQLDGHMFEFTKEGLFIDSELLSPYTKENILSMEEELNRLDYPYLPVIGKKLISGEQLINQLPFSTTHIEKLIDRGILHPNTLKKFRYIASADDISTHFEIIEETTHHSRVERFIDRHLRRSEKLRYMQENAKEVLNA